MNENTLSILGKHTGNQIGVPIKPGDVEIAHCVPVPNSPTNKNVIVQLVPRMKQVVVLEDSCKKRIMTKYLYVVGACPVYADEHLYPEHKRMIGQAVSKRKEANWKFVLVRNEQILARKTQNSSVLKISFLADLAKTLVN